MARQAGIRWSRTLLCGKALRPALMQFPDCLRSPVASTNGQTVGKRRNRPLNRLPIQSGSGLGPVRRTQSERSKHRQEDQNRHKDGKDHRMGDTREQKKQSGDQQRAPEAAPSPYRPVSNGNALEGQRKGRQHDVGANPPGDPIALLVAHSSSETLPVQDTDHQVNRSSEMLWYQSRLSS